MNFDPIRVVSRPKKNAIGIHFGVEVPGEGVYDYTFEEGFRRVSQSAFADGAAIAVVREIPWHQRHVVRARLDQLMRNPRKYDLLSWNCETFAEWLTSGVPKSGQVVGGLLLLGAVVAFAIAARS